MKDTRCPLCLSTDYKPLRKFDVAHLSSKWQWGFGFNPFSKYPSLDSIQQLQCNRCRLIYYDPELIGDEELYLQLMKFDWYHETDKWEFDEALKLISQLKPERLLEIGCADGNFLEKISGKVGYAEGVELNRELVKVCRLKELNVSEKSINEINSSYDMIVLFQVMEHLGGLHEKILQILNLLKKNGLLIISVPNPDSYLKDIETPLFDLPPHHSSGWHRDTFNYMADEHHLTLIQYATEPMRYMHYRYYRDEKLRTKQNRSGPSAKSRLRKLLDLAEQMVISKFYYLNFLLVRKKMTGQTHLAVFRKDV